MLLNKPVKIQSLIASVIYVIISKLLKKDERNEKKRQKETDIKHIVTKIDASN